MKIWIEFYLGPNFLSKSILTCILTWYVGLVIWSSMYSSSGLQSHIMLNVLAHWAVQAGINQIILGHCKSIFALKSANFNLEKC